VLAVVELADVEAARLLLAAAGPVAVEYETQTTMSPENEAQIVEVRERFPRLTGHLDALGPAEGWDSDPGPWVMRGVLDYGRQRALLADDEGNVCLVRGSRSLLGSAGERIADARPVDSFQPNPLWLIGPLRDARLEAREQDHLRLRSSTETAGSDPGVGRIARRFKRQRPLRVDCALDEQRRLSWVEGHERGGVQRFRLRFDHDAPATVPEGAWSYDSLVAPTNMH